MDNVDKTCPFGNKECDMSCSLYILPEDLNETVRNKLASIGVFDRQKGICSLKNMALCMSRYIFENSGGFR